MEIEKDTTQEEAHLGIITKMLAGVCHNCGICAYAEKKPNSTFGKLMRWHRKWCPAWAAHTKVYGEKPLSR